jgi:hypothetical protein
MKDEEEDRPRRVTSFRVSLLQVLHHRLSWLAPRSRPAMYNYCTEKTDPHNLSAQVSFDGPPPPFSSLQLSQDDFDLLHHEPRSLGHDAIGDKIRVQMKYCVRPCSIYLVHIFGPRRPPQT